MRYALLIAWREFIENARTRGFWIGIFIFPAIWVMSAQLTVLLQKKATPVRSFVLVDQTGQFEGVITNSLEVSERVRVLGALQDHSRGLATDNGAVAAALSGEPSRRYREQGDLAGLLETLRPALRPDAPPFIPPPPRFQRLPLPPGIRPDEPLTNLHAQLRPYLRGVQPMPGGAGQGPLFAAVLVPAELRDWAEKAGSASRVPSNAVARSTAERRGIEFWSENQTDPALRNEIESIVNREVRRRQLIAAGVDYALVQRIDGERLPVTSYNPQKSAGNERVGLADSVRQFTPVVFMYLLWVAVFAVAQMLLNSVIEEKSNRIIEVLLSSVTPGELMAGKLMGVAATGLAMVGAWVLSLLGVLFFFAWKSGLSVAHSTIAAAGTNAAVARATSVSGPAQVPAELLTALETTWLLPAFVGYFLLGYLLYAVCILAVGSTCNTLKDAQSYMGVITIVLMFPLISIPFTLRDPNGPLATTLSWIPPYTPFVMMMRVTAHPPLRDVLGTLVLLIVFTLGMVWVSARIFRVGILRTGQPPRLLEWLRWIRNQR